MIGSSNLLADYMMRKAAGEMLRRNPGRIIYTAGGTWRGHSFSAGPFLTAGEASDAKKRWLDSIGYTKPQWWEFWRWGEPKP